MDRVPWRVMLFDPWNWVV